MFFDTHRNTDGLFLLRLKLSDFVFLFCQALSSNLLTIFKSLEAHRLFNILGEESISQSSCRLGDSGRSFKCIDNVRREKYRGWIVGNFHHWLLPLRNGTEVREGISVIDCGQCANQPSLVSSPLGQMFYEPHQSLFNTWLCFELIPYLTYESLLEFSGLGRNKERFELQILQAEEIALAPEYLDEKFTVDDGALIGWQI